MQLRNDGRICGDCPADPACLGALLLMTDFARATPAPFFLTRWLLLGLLLLVVALLVRAPASLLQKAVPAHAGVQVTAWGGTIWHGQAVWQGAGAHGLLRWDVAALQLLMARVVADVRADGISPLQGRLILAPGQAELREVQGALPAALLRSLLPAGWQLPGEVRAEGLGVVRAGLRQGAWTGASGALVWGGGPVQLLLNGQLQQMTLPGVRLVPGVEGEALVLVLAESVSGLGLARLVLGADGRVQTELRERLLRYNPAYRSSGSDPDAIVVTTREAG